MVNLTPADISDSAGAKAVLRALQAKWPWMKTLFADSAKRTVGRKRHIAVDADGRLLMVNLTPADISDSAGAKAVLRALQAKWPWMKTLFADSAYDRAGLMDEAALLDFTFEVARKIEGSQASRSCRAAGSWNAPSPG